VTNTGSEDELRVGAELRNWRSCRLKSTDVDRWDLCVVYGDPHVRAFNGHFQTCRVLGTWPLVDNDYFTVQITNSHMGWGNGTAVTKVYHSISALQVSA